MSLLIVSWELFTASGGFSQVLSMRPLLSSSQEPYFNSFLCQKSDFLLHCSLEKTLLLKGSCNQVRLTQVDFPFDQPKSTDYKLNYICENPFCHCIRVLQRNRTNGILNLNIGQSCLVHPIQLKCCQEQNGQVLMTVEQESAERVNQR